MFTWNKGSKFQKGQSLIEVIIAGLVGMLVVSALTFATIFSLRNANFAKTSVQATKLAQEGIEWVRIGRDHNSSIIISGASVDSWNGISSPINDLWSYQISTGCGTPPGKCFFRTNGAGQLLSGSNYVPTDSNPLPSWAESVGNGFRRVVILSDDAGTQKKVTVIVTWTDTTGPHESKLTTILRKL